MCCLSTFHTVYCQREGCWKTLLRGGDRGRERGKREGKGGGVRVRRGVKGDQPARWPKKWEKWATRWDRSQRSGKQPGSASSRGPEDKMAHRLRLYFGSGRSNTAPELEVFEGDSSERRQQQQEDANHGMMFRMRTPPVSRSPQQEPSTGPCASPSGAAPWGSEEPALKRSSSMFIPQLTHSAEPRTTMSSTMQISLQRSNRPGCKELNGYADDGPPPCYTPPGPAPAYTEPGALSDYPCPPPPPYCSPDILGSHPTELDLPKRRVFSIGSNGHGGSSPGQAGISIGGICIQRNSPDGSEVQQFRILPYGGTGGPLGWFVQQQSVDRGPAVNGGTQRLVFQLQQNQNQSQDQNQAGQRAPSSQEECTNPGFANSGDGRVLRYPRIRLERTSSQQRPPVENQQQCSGAGGQGKDENCAQPETQRTETEDRSKGCTFKIRRETPRRQPHFRICFSPNGSRGQNMNFDHDFAENNQKVNIIYEKKNYKFVIYVCLCVWQFCH